MKLIDKEVKPETRGGHLTRTDIDYLNTQIGELHELGEKTWEDYLLLMSRQWVKSVVETLELARICADAYANLDVKCWNKIQDRVSFGAAKLSIYRQIGADDRLYEKDVIVRLPTSYSTIYQIHLLNAEEFAQAFDSGLIRPSVKREQIERVRLKRGYSKLATKEVTQDLVLAHEEGDCSGQHPIASGASASMIEYVLYGELKVPRNFKRMAELHDELLVIVEKFGVEFEPVPGREARLAHKRQDDLDTYLSRRIGLH